MADLAGESFAALRGWQWFYVGSSGSREGPITHAGLIELLALGKVGFSTLVWREGMADWAPVSTLGELNPDEGLPPPSLDLSPTFLKRNRQRNSARMDCLALFVVFCLALGLEFIYIIPVIPLAEDGPLDPVSILAISGVLFPVALYALIALPLRWRTIMSLPVWTRRLGLIGGFGLIALAVVMALLLFA